MWHRVACRVEGRRRVRVEKRHAWHVEASGIEVHGEHMLNFDAQGLHTELRCTCGDAC